MQMRRLALLVSLLALFAAPAAVFAQESILSFDATAQVQEDGSILISEAITYDFGEEYRHGIYREIPLLNVVAGQISRPAMSDIRVTDELGRPYEFEVSGFRTKSIKIGSVDETINGAHTYLITYTLKRAISITENFDEVYWNVTGTGWQVPMASVSAVVRLPQPVPAAELQTACYAGVAKVQSACAVEPIVRNGSATFSRAELAPGEGLTISVAFPKGMVAGPTTWDVVWYWIMTFGWIVIPVGVFILLFRRWWRYGRDAKGRGAIPVQYDAPNGLSPLAIGTLFDGSVGDRDITAEIVYLAERGYLKIHRVEEKQIVIFNKTDYALIKLKEAGAELVDYQKMLFDALFTPKHMTEAMIDGVPTQVARVSEFGKHAFYKEVKKVQDAAYEWLTTKGYYAQNPSTVKLKYMGAGGVMAFLGIWFMFFPQIGLSLLLSGIMTLFFGAIMPALTAKGMVAKEHVLGLEEYIEAAEKRRIDFHNAPEKNPQEFERLLPHAIALGVEKKWAKQFEGMNIQPGWYGGQQGVFNAMILTSNLGDFRGMAATSFSGSSGGGSGIGGGGSVGGGFGGGGGGSW